MNPSEIAERAAREIYGISLESAHNRGPEFSEEVIASIVERAIEESRGQRWIPVEEKLPEKHRSVLAVDKRGEMGTICRPWGESITHWQPLPDPRRKTARQVLEQ